MFVPLYIALVGASAGPADRVELQVEAEQLDERMQEVMRTAFSRGLTSGGLEIGDSATRVQARVEAVPPDYRVTIEVYADGESQPSASADKTCELCGELELEELAVNLAAKVAASVTETVDAGVLRLAGAPEGAEVRLDGELVGATPLELRGAPGVHTVEVTADGYAPLEYRWKSVADVRSTFSYALEPVTAEGPREGPAGVDPGDCRCDDGRTLRVGGWIALGVGVAATAGGAVLLALDGRFQQSTCAPEEVDASGLCPFTYETTAIGAGSLALGLTALASSIPMLVIGNKRRRSSRRASAGVAPGALVVRGAF